MKEKKQNNYYVYEWIRLDTNEPFYVGKGKGNRWKDLSRKYNPYFMNIINKVDIAVNILHDNLDEDVAYGLEVYYIWLYRDVLGYNLTNVNDGGEGCSLHREANGMYGKSYKDFMTEDAIKEHNRKISEALKNGSHADVSGEKNPMYGKNPWDYMDEETKKRRSSQLKKRMSGKNNPGAKAVICITTLKFFYTTSEGASYYDRQGTHISACCKGKRNYCGKLPDGTPLRWMYLSDFLEKCEYTLL